jgi:hypothetical protein
MKTSRQEKIRRRLKRKARKQQKRKTSSMPYYFSIGGIDEAQAFVDRLAKGESDFSIIDHWDGPEEFDSMLGWGG